MAGPADLTTGADEVSRNVRRLRPLRVLLASRDRRFMRVTAFLLDRRGYDVVQDGSVHVAEAAARWRADVVVVEADSSRASTARLLAALEALPAPPAVVVISADGGVERLPGVTAVAKWTPVDDLARQIDAASLHRAAVRGSRSTRSSL